jgi:hypothetical protein
MVVCSAASLIAVQDGTQIGVELGDKVITINKVDQNTKIAAIPRNVVYVPLIKLSAPCKRGTIDTLLSFGDIEVRRWNCH